MKLSVNEDSHKILNKFEFGADRIIRIRVTCSLVSHRFIIGTCCPDSDFIFYLIFIKLTDNKDRLKISDEFDFGPVLSIGMRVTLPLRAS